MYADGFSESVWTFRPRPPHGCLRGLVSITSLLLASKKFNGSPQPRAEVEGDFATKRRPIDQLIIFGL